MPRSPRVRKPGTRFYYYPFCKRCGKQKGESRSKLCVSCAHYKPKKGILKFTCPHCDEEISRDELVIALYWSGVGSDTLGKVFGITKQRILQITRKSRQENLGLTKKSQDNIMVE